MLLNRIKYDDIKPLESQQSKTSKYVLLTLHQVPFIMSFNFLFTKILKIINKGTNRNITFGTEKTKIYFLKEKASQKCNKGINK